MNHIPHTEDIPVFIIVGALTPAAGGAAAGVEGDDGIR